jgi:drug/metabolite transporter (DMT)-like permease
VLAWVFALACPMLLLTCPRNALAACPSAAYPPASYPYGDALASGAPASTLARALTPAEWAGVGWGASMAVVYGLASLASHRWALQADSPTRFLSILIGSLLARMAAALVALTLVLATTSLDERAFIGSFFGVFVLALIFEVAYLHRQAGGDG